MSRGSYSKGVAKRTEIVEAALDLIGREGYRAASVREIAAAVGLTPAGVMHHFSSKDELFAEILRRRDELSAASDPTAVDLPTAFAQTIRHNAGVPGLIELYQRLAAEASSPQHGAREYFEGRYTELVEAIAEGIAESQKAGIVRDDIDATLAARMFIAVADGMQTQWLLGQPVQMDEVVDLAWRLLQR